ncbi:MAG: Cyclic-di-AMP phosphodiesterase PgpH [Cryomorphaceae bacterium]|nr:MAG: Cyclic-di-AMP phosphodiesterase PgpH [Cryomorphaceae bacterium]
MDPRNGKNYMKAPNWFRISEQWLYYSLIAMVSSVLIYISIPSGAQFKYDYRLGQIWLEEDLMAPQDFVLQKSDEELESDRKFLIENKDFYYDYHYRVDEWLANTNIDSSLHSELELWQKRGVAPNKPALNHRLYLVDGTRIDLSGAWTPSSLVANYGLPEALVLPPTYSLNEYKTDSALQAKLALLPSNKGLVAQGTLIIAQGSTVNEQKYETLKALERSYDRTQSDSSIYSKLGSALYILLIFIGLAFFLRLHYNAVLAHSSSLNLYMFTFTAGMVVALLLESINSVSALAVPLLLVPVIIRSFFSDRLALFTHTIMLVALLPFVSSSVQFVTVQFSAGLITLFLIRGIYKRSQLVQSTFQIMVVLLLVHLSIHLIRESDWTTQSLLPVAYSLGGTLILLFIFPLIYFFERTFGVVSDLTLLELSDTNSPLLKLLSKEAPGTFQHTMQVANLAEFATEIVGGNTLLVRTGALYHDIGKIANPQYFTENQSSTTSPHEELSYLESAEIIIEHINDGIELAKKYKLPDIVIDFIRTHHGTSRVEYFYRKYREDHPDTDQFDQFHYPGPKPFSKETAIVMMSDAVEASTRSIPDKSEKNLSEMIDKVIGHQLSTGQYDNAEITMKEINTIREAFKRFIRGVYHVRISYPEAE